MSEDLLRILIAEDEPAHAEAICRAMKRGLVQPQIKVVETLAAYRIEKEIYQPDIALVDLNLPDGRAVDVLTLPVESAPFPVLIMTSYGNEQTAVEAMKAGALDYVVKSFEAFSAIPQTVQRALREWRLIRKKGQAESALRESEAFVNDVLNSLTSQIAVLDENEAVMAVNEAWRQINQPRLGSKESIGENYIEMYAEILEPEGAEALQGISKCIRSVRDGLVPYSAMEYFYPPEQRWFYLWVSPLKRALGGVVCAHSDITQRKLAEERIAHLNYVLRSIRDINQITINAKKPEDLIQSACERLVIEHSYTSVVMILIDENGEIDAYSKAGIEAIIEKTLIQDLERGHLPDCFRKTDSVEDIFHMRHDSKECRTGMIAADYAQLDALCIALSHDRTCHGYMAVFLQHELAVDPEEQALFKEMARDLAFSLSNLKLGKTILRTEKERDNFQAQFLQAQKMEAIGRLAGGVAHDFNNMLNIILGYGELALENVSPNEPLREELNEIMTAAQRSTDLIRQLLAFARKQAISPKVLDLNQLVADHKRMIKRLVGEDIDLRFIAGPDLWPILVDESQIDQILANFAVNSRDAISGVGTITISTENAVIDQAYCEAHSDYIPGEYVRLNFEDSGKGMTREVLNHLFEPFFTTKGKDKGTGLGLSTIYGIVKQNNGFINVYSEVGHGTVFQVYFPRYSGDLPQSEFETKEEVPLTGHETILVVDDEPQILRFSQKMLESLGYNVLVAQLPGEAILLCEKYLKGIDLLITDVVMPNMDGNELKERIEAIKPGIKTLFMSGYTADVIAHRRVFCNGRNYIQKPFSLKSLALKVREVLARI